MKGKTKAQDKGRVEKDDGKKRKKHDEEKDTRKSNKLKA